MQLFNGDCLDLLPQLPDASVDMVMCDLPYGTTQNKWDTIIPLEPLWAQYRRVCKPGAAIVLTAAQPFTSVLVMSNLCEFKYQWVWDKKIPSGMAYARYQPMRQHEDILVFYKNAALYNPQKTLRDVPIKAGGMRESSNTGKGLGVALKKEYLDKHPTSILTFDKIRRNSQHPTEKPVALMEYLIRTYTHEGMIVLDNCMGSGTTGVACVNTARDFIGMEREAPYFQIAQDRIIAALTERLTVAP